MENNEFYFIEKMYLNNDSDDDNEEWTNEDTEDILDIMFPDGYDDDNHGGEDLFGD